MQELQARTSISERRACQLIGLSRSVLRYHPRASAQNTELQAQLVEQAQKRRRFGLSPPAHRTAGRHGSLQAHSHLILLCSAG